MGTRPYVVLSCAMSIDGYIDDSSPERLVLSNADDLDRVDQVRAECDAILIGANTLRRDNPGLLVKSATRREARGARGLAAHPTKVIVTSGGDLSAESQCWHSGADKLVYCPDAAVAKVRQSLGALAEVVGVGRAVDFGGVLDDLAVRGIGRLLVEGGGRIHTQFLTGDLADELQLVIAPFFVGDETAPRFVHSGAFRDGPGRRMTLAELRSIGDVALLRYLPTKAGAEQAGGR